MPIPIESSFRFFSETHQNYLNVDDSNLLDEHIVIRFDGINDDSILELSLDEAQALIECLQSKINAGKSR